MRTAAEDVNAKVAAISDTQQQLQSDVQSVNTAIDELDATLMETVQNLRQVVQDFNTLVRIRSTPCYCPRRPRGETQTEGSRAAITHLPPCEGQGLSWSYCGKTVVVATVVIHPPPSVTCLRTRLVR